ncbi:aldo/keto reductase [Candidatus Saccharibacteria bacterium]|nr:aldo/keto reductase [Candidatus Saccharibacteria bacterium]
MPGFGFGTWNLTGNECVEVTGEALRVGYRLIDTAKIYGNEVEVGEAIRKSSVPREEIFVTTKLWPNDFGYEDALRAFDESLERLGLEYIDLYLIHWPRSDKQKRQDSWRALCEIYKQGRAKSIGVSNYAVEHLKEALTSDAPPAVNQIEFHPYIYEEQRPILEFCKKHGIIVEAYSPLSQGHGLNSITVRDISERTGRTPAQVVLRWAIQHDTIPIPKSAHPERIKENIQVFDFELSADDMKMLDNLSLTH